MNGWSGICFGLLALPFAIIDHSAIIAAAVLIGLGWNELRLRKRLRLLEPEAASLLAWNQLALLGAVLVYCAWQIAGVFGPPSESEQMIATADPAMAETIGRVRVIATLSIYGLLALASIGMQGGFALYYRSRGRIIHRCLVETPEWAIELHRTRTAA